jgi:hypothetical protein
VPMYNPRDCINAIRERMLRFDREGEIPQVRRYVSLTTPQVGHQSKELHVWVVALDVASPDVVTTFCLIHAWNGFKTSYVTPPFSTSE